MHDCTLDVHWMPTLVAPEDLARSTVVVIDVLRASTTIVHALAAGAREIVPCLEIEDARTAAARFSAGEVLLAGERDALPIEGFDLGNSPAEYTPETIAGRTLVLTTSNGTRAMARCRRADRVLIGAFVNAGAIYEQLLGCPKIDFLSAGTHGRRSHDDELLAGMFVGWIERFGITTCRLTSRAEEARDQWAASLVGSFAPGVPADSELLAQELAKSLAGQRLASIGQESDVLLAAQIDRFRVVPELDLSSFRIRN
jgi:2-phosphosulfolactate phosphatase